ncbi:uncharacterized protein LOC129923054 isoform X3 [Biomphalaria glabrata]|uniref:Uncharacterized protein LOC129923054 isoform X3 n=1 Tax=Biomphalaria glabrata TaxID=6526 RepID=A0A9W2YYX0_BIOGL|nr:uncharacterized protein LOC129923054 isoform X3 [Biomphalaria glabrata]
MYLLLLLTLTLFPLVMWCQRTVRASWNLEGGRRSLKADLKNGSNDFPRNLTDGSCLISNMKVFKNNVVFTLPGLSRCTKHICRNGKIEVYEHDCLDMFGQCHKPGARFPVHKDGITYGSCTCKTDLTGNRINVCKKLKRIYILGRTPAGRRGMGAGKV